MRAEDNGAGADACGEFAQQFGGAYLAAEGALWHSLKLLLLKPGELTVQYLAGRRKTYVLPLRLYLTISLLVLLLVSPGRQWFDGDQGGRHSQDRQGKPQHDHRRGRGPGRPSRRCVLLRRPASVGVQAHPASPPIIALWLKLAYRNRNLRYTEHLVFALHVHAFWFVALLFTLPGWGLLTALALLAMPVYTLTAMKRVYGGRRWPRLLRACLVSALYVTTSVLALAGVALFSLFS